MDKKVKIGKRIIGPGEPVFIVAEMGVNHNGSLPRLKAMIRAAIAAGADAIKFQTFKAEDFLRPGKEEYSYKREGQYVKESMFEMFKRLEVPLKWHKVLFEHVARKNRVPFSTPMDENTIDFLARLGVSVFKVGADDLTNYPLIEYMAKKKRPVILSTGMSFLREVEAAVEVIIKTGNNNIILLHCVSLYPARADDVNLRAMDFLRKRFGFPVGFSDHTQGIVCSLAAVARGANVIEKHFTLDKSLSGPDHWFSADPKELKTLVDSIREVEKALGCEIKRPSPGEEKMRRLCRRSIIAAAFISKGTIIKKDMVCLKRPGTGLGPQYFKKVIGKRVKKDIERDSLISLKDLR